MTRKVFITGGSSGIGLELAKHYVQEGDNVVLLARNQSKLDDAVVECEHIASAGQAVSSASLDVADFDTLPVELEAICAQHGTPDLLILSAGVVESKRFLEMSREDFDWIMQVNLGGVREVTRNVLPAMLARGSGQLVIISSMAGLIGTYGYSAYCASKFALQGFAASLQHEIAGTGVSINMVCPGEVDTPMVQAEAGSILPQTRFMKDTVGTLPADVAARKIAAGIAADKSLIVPGVRPWLTSRFARHFPRLFTASTSWLLKLKFDR